MFVLCQTLPLEGDGVHVRSLPVTGSMCRTADAAPIIPSLLSRYRLQFAAPLVSFGFDIFRCRSAAFALLFRFSRFVKARDPRHRSSVSPASFANDLAFASSSSFNFDFTWASFAFLISYVSVGSVRLDRRWAHLAYPQEQARFSVGFRQTEPCHCWQSALIYDFPLRGGPGSSGSVLIASSIKWRRRHIADQPTMRRVLVLCGQRPYGAAGVARSLSSATTGSSPVFFPLGHVPKVRPGCFHRADDSRAPSILNGGLSRGVGKREPYSDGGGSSLLGTERSRGERPQSTIDFHCSRYKRALGANVPRTQIITPGLSPGLFAGFPQFLSGFVRF
jgi:hypothetical protein